MPTPQTARPERAVLLSESEQAAWLRLVLTRGIGPVQALKLLRGFGPPQDIFRADPAALARVLSPALAQALLQSDPQRAAAVDQALQWAHAPDHQLLTLGCARYPAALLHTTDPPPLLYLRGRPQALAGPCLAIVGSRHPSVSGARSATEFARTLGQAGLAIVSGLALGIDAAAHQGALGTPGGTIAVLGTGVDTVYPAANRALADAIVDAGGAVVSELPLGTGPRPANFPRRNRLIAGLSQGVLVVEAALRSGSLITARLAAEAGREVFAIPGSIHSPLSKGCHALLKQGARLVEDAHDVLSELPPLAGPKVAAALPSAPPTDTSDPLLALMGWDPVSFDLLIAAGAGDTPSVAARLLELELTGHIDRLADGRYQRRP